MIWLLNIISPDHTWRERLLDLINQHQIDTTLMGFPNDYQQYPLWK
jgi:hypothetical protein